jgi:hypothetical protein
MFLVWKQETTMIKPQDTLVAMKYCSLFSKYAVGDAMKLKVSDVRMSYREMSAVIDVSAGEISKGVKRLEASHLLTVSSNGIILNKHNLAEWMIHGAKYSYPMVKVGFGRGLPTGWNCKYIKSDIVPPEPGMAWKSRVSSSGDIQAELVEPIHPSVPFAASKDPFVHKAFSLLDILRSGRPRECNVAREMLFNLIMTS